MDNCLPGIMFDIGFIELILVAVVALLVIGPERLPAAARVLGKWAGIAKGLVNHVKEEIDREVQTEAIKAQFKQAADEARQQFDSNDIKQELQESKQLLEEGLEDVKTNLQQGEDAFHAHLQSLKNDSPPTTDKPDE